MRRLLLVGLVALVPLVGGCASNMLTNQTDTNTSLVFGYLDMSDAPSDVRWLNVKQVAPKVDKPFYSMSVEGGMFFSTYLQPGSYQLSSFGGFRGFIFGQNYRYSFRTQSGEEARFRIQAPGVHFIGAFKYVKAGSFFSPKFQIDRVNSPTERELLERLLKFAQGTTWETRIQARLQRASR